MEAYEKDAVYELVNEKIRRVNSEHLGDPIPTTEDEDIMIDLEIDDAEKDETGPFNLVSTLARERVKQLLWRNSVESGIEFLKKGFHITIENQRDHIEHWRELKRRRNEIVHSKASPAPISSHSQGTQRGHSSNTTNAIFIKVAMSQS